jgi:MFS family permease
VQEGHDKHWAGWIIAMIVGGLAVLGIFVWWQAINSREPLVPLGLFKDRNFSVSNVAITTMGFIAASFGFPLMLYAQAVRGYNPTQAALLLVPMAIMSILLAKYVGGLTDRAHPRLVVGFGFAISAVGMLLLTWQLEPGTSVWWLCAFQVLVGIGNAFIWAPTAATANRNLPMHLAGAGAGVYNATRQVGSVVGSAAIAVLMSARISHYLPGAGVQGEAGANKIADHHVADLFSTAMQQSLLLPTLVYVVGLVAVLFYEAPKHEGYAGRPAPTEATAAAG